MSSSTVSLPRMASAVCAASRANGSPSYARAEEARSVWEAAMGNPSANGALPLSAQWGLPGSRATRNGSAGRRGTALSARGPCRLSPRRQASNPAPRDVAGVAQFFKRTRRKSSCAQESASRRTNATRSTAPPAASPHRRSLCSRRASQRRRCDSPPRRPGVES
jgi:hypothetical protein